MEDLRWRQYRFHQDWAPFEERFVLARTVAATRSIGSGLAGSLSGTCFEHSTSPHIGARVATGASIFGCATRQVGDPNLNTYAESDGAKLPSLGLCANSKGE